MSRWKAGAIHFSISLLIFLGLLAVILFLWYPGILFNIDRGWAGLQLLIGVDLIAGPLLTLVVFKSGKKGLNFDLACIAFFQAACLVAGMWVVYSERPIVLVLAYDTIYSVDTQEFLEYDRNPDVLESYPGAYPKLVYLELPESEFAVIRSQFIGDPLYVQTEKYHAMPAQADGVKKVFRALEKTKSAVPESVSSQLDESCIFSRFISSIVSGFVCFDTNSRKLEKFYKE
tara:strand:- start:686 stop:1375 length:690 start_codon:yes stop_codon:yes gene_type:complete